MTPGDSSGQLRESPVHGEVAVHDQAVDLLIVAPISPEFCAIHKLDHSRDLVLVTCRERGEHSLQQLFHERGSINITCITP